MAEIIEYDGSGSEGKRRELSAREEQERRQLAQKQREKAQQETDKQVQRQQDIESLKTASAAQIGQIIARLINA